MNEYRVRRARPIAGEISVPGDLHVSRLAIIAAALANGPGIISGFLPAEECRALLDAITGRGARVEFLSAEDDDLLWEPDPAEEGPQFPARVRIHGTGMGSGARGLIHLLPEGPDRAVFSALLKTGRSTLTLPPEHPRHVLHVLRHHLVKTAVRDGALLTWGGQVPESRDLTVPGDISVAAQWITAAAMQPGSDLTVRGTGLERSRTAFLRVLVEMGAHITEDIWPAGGRSAECQGSVIVRGAPLRGVQLTAAQTALLARELPVLAVAAAFAKGKSTLRVPPALSATASRIAGHLSLLGVEVSDLRDAIVISGTGLEPFQPACLRTGGDPFLGMACAVAGLCADGETLVEDTDCIERTWPGFGRELRRFQSRAISAGTENPVINTWKMAEPGTERAGAGKVAQD